jgi:membrane associated rhomboid family serine protease
MIKEQSSYTVWRAFAFCLNLTFGLMLIFLLDQFIVLDDLTLKPREVNNFISIVTASFIHAHIFHLLLNVLGIITIMVMLSAARLMKTPLLDLLIIAIGSNVLVFVFGNPDYHYLGASNLVYGFMGYALVAFTLNKKFLFLLGLVILSTLFWPGLIYGKHDSISYISHYSGLLIGMLLFLVRFFRTSNYYN